MRVGDLAYPVFARRFRFEGLPLRLGPFAIKIRVDYRPLAAIAYELYSPYRLAPDDGVFDAHVRLASGFGPRRWIRPQSRIFIDGRQALAPHALRHAFPSLEWGINWCMATRAQHLLMLHAAVVERGGSALLFPAAPGYGKSTLGTALSHSGWRLLSDEFGLVHPDLGALIPVPRLIPLKNESIAVIRRFAPEAFIGPAFPGTHKGTVAHVRPPAESIRRSDETARARWLVFPRWLAGSPLALEPVAKSRAFLMVAANAFNYEVLGETAFRLVTGLIDDCDCYTLTYSNLEEAVAALARLTGFVDD